MGRAGHPEMVPRGGLPYEGPPERKRHEGVVRQSVLVAFLLRSVYH